MEAGSFTEAFGQRRRRRVLLFCTVALGILVTASISISAGQYDVPLLDLGKILLAGPLGGSDLDSSVLWHIRLPRLVLGLFVGAALGVSGVLLQAVFANPLAEPSVIGVSSGAGVGAAVSIVFGLHFLGGLTTPFCAFIAALATTVLAYQLARFNGTVRVTNLILVGIVVNALAGAAIALLTFLAPTTARENIVFWQMGTLAGATWEHTGIVAAITVAALVGAMFMGTKLDLLALGETAAYHVGISVTALRLTAIAVSTLLTAAAVSFAGLIGFVGLVVPHMVRTVIGPANSALIPASALGGALMISAGDLLARTLVSFADLPIGIFTALIGGPVFFLLLRRMLGKGGVS